MNPDVHDIEYAVQFIKPFGCRTAVDVGANRGDTTKVLLNEGFDVLALEPNKNFYRQLAALGPRVKAVSVAASDSERQVEMYVMKDDGLNSIQKDWPDRVFSEAWTGDKVWVDAKPLFTVFAQEGITDVAFCKIDAEGHDYEALVGMFPMTPQVVMFEANELMKEGFVNSLLLLRKRGYTKFSIFVRAGAELLAMERFNVGELPNCWNSCQGSRFYANVIARL